MHLSWSAISIHPRRPWYSPTKHQDFLAEVGAFCIGFSVLSGDGSEGLVIDWFILISREGRLPLDLLALTNKSPTSCTASPAISTPVTVVSVTISAALLIAVPVVKPKRERSCLKKGPKILLIDSINPPATPNKFIPKKDKTSRNISMPITIFLLELGRSTLLVDSTEFSILK